MPVLFLEESDRENMTPELRTRIVTSLRWLVEDAKHRFDDCKDAMGQGSTGGYSPDLTSAIKLLDDLCEPEMFLAERPQAKSGGIMLPTEQQCRDMAAMMAGGTEQDGIDYFVYYAPRGFVFKSGQPIGDHRIAIRGWIMSREESDSVSKRETTAERLERIRGENRV